MLSRTIESALAQSYAPTEIIVLDDGSTDDTPTIVKHYSTAVRYIRQDNCGVAVARTNACQLAAGEYIAFLDDDDLMTPDRLETLYSALTRYPEAVLAVGELATIDEDDTLIECPAARERQPVLETLYQDGFEAVMWPHVPAAPHTTLFRRSHGEQIGWFDTQYQHASEDKDFFARLGRLGPIVFVPKVVSLYRRGHASLTQNRIRTILTQLQLFTNALEFIGSSNDKLRKRLQLRMRLLLQDATRIIQSEGLGGATQTSSPNLRGFVVGLPARELLRYRFFQIKLFVKQVLKSLLSWLRSAR